ncbi:MAG: signal peptide peptidase SppA [Candidatus Babeliales bacterium]
MKKNLMWLLLAVMQLGLAYPTDDVIMVSGLLKNACLAAKEFNTEDKKYQSYMTIAAASFAMIPVIYALGKAAHELRKTKVAVIEIRGMIDDGLARRCCDQIKKIDEDASIKAVLLKIDSGGGYSVAGDFIRNELHILAEKKPIIALVEGICASAAYHIAAAAHYIVAPEKSAVGSIGTYSQYLKFSSAAEYNRLGAYGMSAQAKIETFKGGKYKALHDPFKEFTVEEKEYLQKSSDEHYELFYTNIARDRNLTVETKELWADAQVFTGRTALQRGLVDEIGTLTNAHEAIKRLVEEHTGKSVGKLRFVSMQAFPPVPAFLRFFSAESLADFAYQIVEKFNQKQLSAQTANSLHTIE